MELARNPTKATWPLLLMARGLNPVKKPVLFGVALVIWISEAARQRNTPVVQF